MSYQFQLCCNKQLSEPSIECSQNYPPFTFTTTEYSYAATGCVSVHRRHAGDRATTDLGGVPYYGMRYYNPDLGRWISRDPIGEEGGLNVYIFIKNECLNKWDSIGQEYDDLKAPDCGPCKWLGYSKGNISGAVTEFKIDPQYVLAKWIRKDYSKKIRCDKGSGCVSFEFEDFSCSFEIIFGTSQPHDPTHTTTAVEHEKYHVRVFVDFFNELTALINSSESRCIATECVDEYEKYFDAKAQEIDWHKNYKNAEWHAIDYPTKKQRQLWKAKALSYKSEWNRFESEAKKAWTDYLTCATKALNRKYQNNP